VKSVPVFLTSAFWGGSSYGVWEIIVTCNLNQKNHFSALRKSNFQIHKSPSTDGTTFVAEFKDNLFFIYHAIIELVVQENGAFFKAPQFL